MERFQQPFRVSFILFLFFVFLLTGCMPRVTVKETAHYKFYEDIELVASTNFGTWTKTEIQIPKGAIVAVMAKGEVWDTRNPSEWHWQPYNTLRFKVGQEGRVTHIDSGLDIKVPYNLNVTPSGNGGFLYFGMGTWWRNRDPKTKMGKITASAIVWEKDRQDQIESDLLKLIRDYPKDPQFRFLVAFMANCFGNIGEYQKVQNLYQMMKENPEIEWDRVFPTVLNHLSDFERMLGRNENAKVYLEEALKGARRFGNRYMESIIISRLGRTEFNQKRYEQAHLLFEQSLKIAIEINSIDATGTCYNSMGLNLLRMNKPSEAIEHFKKALEQYRQRDRYLAQRWVYLNLGEAYMRLNKNMAAKKCFESTIKVALKASDPQPQWSAHQWLGRIAEREGDNQAAFDHYAEAIKVVESLRAKYTDPELKALFMKDKFRLYERMIQLLYKMQRSPEAFHYLERARARAMLDMLAEKTFSSRNKEENELLNQERDLRKRIEEISTRQERIAIESPQDPEEEILDLKEPKMAPSELERLQAQHRAVLEKIEKINPELASLVSINPLKADEIQMLLDGETALIEYFIGMEKRFIFVVTKEKIMAMPLEIDPKKLFQKIREFRDRAVEGITLDRLLSKVYERPLLELYEILIQPIGKEIFGKKNLIIVPHGMLHYLPFQALLSKDGKYLIESFTISYLPSATVLRYARAKNRGNRTDLFAAGNPVTGLEPLPAAELEVKEVSAIFEKKLVLTGPQATKTSVKSQGPRYDLMLLSTHGEMIESNPLKSNLRFTPSERNDGKLTVNEIFDMEIKANLVTLSACETALVKGETGDFPQGDDLVGLSRAFIHAGAPSVVASLWKVSDDSTVQLMRNFYQNMRNMPKAEALRKAQMDLMKSTVRFTITRAGGGVIQPTQKGSEEAIECSHPFFWAPFILLGDWR
jgi:CHAT domain-containing protein/Tfp pilus assembly protein PilF